MENQKNEAFKKTFIVNDMAEEKLVTLHEFVEYDERGKEICHRYYKGKRHHPDDPELLLWHDADGKNIWHNYKVDCFEVRREYDANGNEIHCKKSNGYEHWYEYDERGNCVQGKVAMNGVMQKKEWYDYDERGNFIHWKQVDLKSEVYEEWLEYDKNGNCTSRRNSEGLIDRYEYDENGNKLCHWTWYWPGQLGHYYEYNVEGKLVLEKRGKKVVRKYEYDKNGNRILCWNGKGSEEHFKYDEHGRITYHSDAKDHVTFFMEEWRNYNEAGLEVRRKFRTKSYEETRWYEYEYHENGELKTLTIYRHHEKLEKTDSSSRQSVAESEESFDELEENLGQ